MAALIEVEAAIKPSQQVKDLIRDKKGKKICGNKKRRKQTTCVFLKSNASRLGFSLK